MGANNKPLCSEVISKAILTKLKKQTVTAALLEQLEKRQVHTWPVTVKKYHLYSRDIHSNLPLFNICFGCCLTGECILYKAGAQACTIRNEILNDKVR